MARKARGNSTRDTLSMSDTELALMVNCFPVSRLLPSRSRSRRHSSRLRLSLLRSVTENICRMAKYLAYNLNANSSPLRGDYITCYRRQHK
ncbi:hypothetical protein E2C01_015373 [Portunus trituberculatus]|uniref:Uncharacterized protein n=1 Tax=Portunus trituberculatus TaxID=210409 RepID=A0A5B7DLG6_PORTR|nr:hypothetical protein [Portunus trituberculatus]